jgi:hypothetical protein
LAATIGLWRRSDGPELEGKTDVRNITLLSAPKEVLDFLDTTIRTKVEKLQTKPSTYTGADDPRFMNFLNDLFNRVSRDLKNIGDAPVMSNDRSVPVIDRLLRRLAGYMTVNDITFPVLSIIDPSKPEVLISPRNRALRAPKQRVLQPR